MQRANKGESVIFDKCTQKVKINGIVESVLGKDTVNESYVVRTDDGKSLIVYPKDVESAMIALRKKSSKSQPKIKKNCGCK
jgi:hypothetical protein